MTRSSFSAPTTADAAPPANAPFANVTVRSLTSWPWALALPVSASVTCVALSRVNTAVRPSGTLVAVTWPPDTTSLVKVSLASRMTTPPDTEPSLASVSARPLR